MINILALYDFFSDEIFYLAYITYCACFLYNFNKLKICSPILIEKETFQIFNNISRKNC